VEEVGVSSIKNMEEVRVFQCKACSFAALFFFNALSVLANDDVLAYVRVVVSHCRDWTD